MNNNTLKRVVRVFLALAVFGIYPLRVFAQTVEWSSSSIDCLAGPDKDVATIQCLVPLFRNAVVALVELASIALFIMFIAGGFVFITSGGNPKKLEQAKSTLTYAIIGLVVIVMAFLIIQLVSTITGATGLNQFTIPEATLTP